jgi:hypothetical protein
MPEEKSSQPAQTEDVEGAMRRDTAEGIRQMRLARVLSFARPGSVSLRLSENRFALTTLQTSPEGAERPLRRFDLHDMQRNATADSSWADTAALHATVLGERPAAKTALVFRGRFLTAWAISRKPIPVRYFQLLNYTKAPELPVAIVEHPSDVIPLKRALAENPDTPCVLLSNGDVVTWSTTIVKAARLAISLDEAAQVTALADRLGGAKPYPAGIPEAIYTALAPYS